MGVQKAVGQLLDALFFGSAIKRVFPSVHPFLGASGRATLSSSNPRFSNNAILTQATHKN